jgi:hypothetical protein
VLHKDPEALHNAEFKVEVAPSRPGSYVLYLPVPGDAQGKSAPGFGLRVVEGAPNFGLVQSEHGVALRIAADGPVKLYGTGDLPVRLTLDDVHFSFRQFRFWAYLGRDAPGDILVKVEVRERDHNQDWEKRLDTSRAIVLQEPLEPKGWQALRATQLFDIAYGGGYSDGFPRVAIAALMTTALAGYVPTGMVAFGWWRARREANGSPR